MYFTHLKREGGRERERKKENERERKKEPEREIERERERESEREKYTERKNERERLFRGNMGLFLRETHPCEARALPRLGAL